MCGKNKRQIIFVNKEFELSLEHVIYYKITTEQNPRKTLGNVLCIETSLFAV